MKKVSALLLLLLVLGFAAQRSWRRSPDRFRALARAALGNGCRIEARLSRGFGWALFDGSPHASAVAQLLAGDARRAVEILDELPPASMDAAAWNDLAAARFHLATHYGEILSLIPALVAADAALAGDPASPEARFNRALIVERLGLRALARDLPVEANASFGTWIERDYDRLASDPAAASAVAGRFRRPVRMWGVAELLGDWGVAERAGNQKLARKSIAAARNLAAGLARDYGDVNLEREMVAAVERADADLRLELAGAHVRFRAAQQAYLGRRDLDRARLLFAAAAAVFERAKSPAALRARAHAAWILLAQGKLTDARREAEDLFASAPEPFPLHRADLVWLFASIAYREGRFRVCLEASAEAAMLHERLGEPDTAAAIRGLMIQACDRLGYRTRAREQRLFVLRDAGVRLSSEHAFALALLVQGAVIDQDWPAAHSLLTLEIDAGRKLDDPYALAHAFVGRAEMNLWLGRKRAALSDIAGARRNLARFGDQRVVRNFTTMANSIEGALSPDPAKAIGYLTEAIELPSTAAFPMFHAEALRRRGRAFAAIGRLDRAAADFEAAVAYLEQGRKTLPAGEDRWGTFSSADQLFGDAIALALRRGDPRTAFDYAERARARALLDSVGAPWRPVRPADIPAGTTLIEYAVQHETTHIFVVDERGVRAVSRAIERRQVAAAAGHFLEACAAGDDARCTETGRTLYRWLVAPVAGQLAGRRLVVVPDAVLDRVPFAALRDGTGLPLLMRHAVTVEPSAAVFALRRSVRSDGGGRNVLVVGGSGDLRRLPGARREMRAVARLYSRSTVLEDAEATSAAFVRHAAVADVVHFAGHTVTLASGRRGRSLVLAAGGADDGRLDQERIASMRLPRRPLVVLAGCGTAAGEVRGTEGTISVARAFLAAGARGVVATLWPVDDYASAELFAVFHHHLARGLAPADALREAQLESLQLPAPSPAIWAAVQIMGE